MNILKWNVRYLLVIAILVMAFAPRSTEAAPYVYKSDAYGFSITCPQKPVGIVELSTISPEEKGTVLIFANEGYTILHAWIVSDDAFHEAALPNFDKLSKDVTESYLKSLTEGGLYETASIVDINGTKGLYAITKDEPKQVRTFFRAGDKRFAVTLVENPALTQGNLEAYLKALMSFESVK